jgi:general secretion pathway protein F
MPNFHDHARDEGGKPRPAALSSDESAQLAGHLVDLTAARLPLAAGLRALAEGDPGGRLPDVLTALADELEAGRSLEAALDALGEQIPAHIRAMLRAGLQSGQVGGSLQTFLDQRRRLSELRYQLRRALAYPLLVLMLLIPLMLALCRFVAPLASSLFGDDVPSNLRLAMWFGDRGLIWLAAAVAATVVALGLTRWLGGSTLWHRLRASLPLVGPLFVWSGLAECTRTLATLLEHRVPLPEALRDTAAGLSDGYIGRGCGQLAEAAAQGQSLPEAMARIDAFPPSLVTLTAWGVEGDQLPEAWTLAGRAYEERAALQISLLRAVAPPIIFLLVAAAVVFLISQVLVPIAQIGSMLSWNSGSGAIETSSPLALLVATLQFLLLGVALRVALRLAYGVRGAPEGDWVYFLMNVASRLLLVAAVMVAPVMLAGLFGMSLWILTAFVGAIWLGQTKALRRRVLLSMLTIGAERGLPLPAVVAAVAQEQSGFAARRAERLARLLAEGHSLPEALRLCPRALPWGVRPYLHVGTEIAALPEALRQAADAQQRDSRLWRGITPQLLYVLIVVLATAQVATFCIIKIVPAFQKIFDDFGMSLPPLTQLFFALSSSGTLLFSCLYVLLIVGVPMVVMFWLLAQLGWIRGIPLLDRLMPGRHTAAVLGCLALAAERQRPLSHLLYPLSNSYPMRYIARRLRAASRDVDDGVDWRESLRARKLLGKTEAAVLTAAQRAGNLPWALRAMADHAARRSTYRLQATLQIVFPLALLGLALAVAFMVVALFHPLVRLIGSLT